MSDFTPRANLRLPGGGSTGTILPDEQVDIDVLNDNFRKIDALLGARNIPSASSYSGSMDGDLVYARDTEFLHMFSTTAGGLITPRLPGARQYSGTQAERVAFVSKAKDGDLWRDTDNIGVIWVLKAGTPNTWVYSGNKLRGDRTAMDKLVTDGMAVEGMTVFNTTDNSEYVRLGASWLTTGMLLGYDTSTAGANSADGSALQHPDLSISLNLPEARRVRFEVSCTSLGGGGGTVAMFEVRSGATAVTSWSGPVNSSPSQALTGMSHTLSKTAQLAAGTHTLTLWGARITGSGSFQFSATSTSNTAHLAVYAA